MRQMNNVTIREFKDKLSFYLKNIGVGLVVTSRGEKIALVTTYKPDVTTLKPLVITSDVTTSPLVTTSKQSIIASLKSQINNIEHKEQTGYCLACKKLGRRREAIEQVVVYENEQERLTWLCKEHLSKHCVNA